jgi:hypothetical protein
MITLLLAFGFGAVFGGCCIMLVIAGKRHYYTIER